MKTSLRPLTILHAIVAIVLLSAHHADAITNTTIAIQGTNVVISWPSKTGASYLIQFRSAFDTNPPWVNLTNAYPAATGTNRTTYVLQGVVSPMPYGGGGGFTDPPPGPTGGTQLDSDFTMTESTYPLDAETVAFLQNRRVFPPYLWDQQGRAPYPWELEVRPPMPWEGFALPVCDASLALSATTSTETQITESSGSTTAGAGFYRIFQLPSWPNGISNAAVEGFTFAPVDFDDYFDQVFSFTLLVDSQPSELGYMQRREYSGTTYDGVDFWFDQMPNGSRSLRMVANIRLDSAIDLGSPSVSLTSVVTRVQVTNLLMFTNWDSTIVGNTTKFETFSTIPNVDWEIDVYDVVNDWVQSASGYSADGRISWTWNLIDAGGMTRDDLDYDPVFYTEITITPQGSGFTAATPATKPGPLKVLDYPANDGEWAIVYQDREKRPGPRADYIEAMNDLAGGPAWWNIYSAVLMLEYGTNVTQQVRNDTWYNFRAILFSRDVRNFYYQGHGSPNTIGGDFDTCTNGTNFAGAGIGTGSVASLNSGWVRNNVTHNQYRGDKYFRFVFLDGCDTANGDWPGAFGMAKATNTIAFYTNPNRTPHTRPSCFVGWNKVVGGDPTWGTTATYGLWRSEWMFQWAMIEENLDQSFRLARSNSSWISQTLMDSSLRLYGFNPLGFGLYNRRSQWNGQ
jgi:hypothetical protein